MSPEHWDQMNVFQAVNILNQKTSGKVAEDVWNPPFNTFVPRRLWGRGAEQDVRESPQHQKNNHNNFDINANKKKWFYRFVKK